ARRARAQLGESGDRAVDVDAAAGAGVYGDESLLERALGNLADNAVRHGAGAIRFAAGMHAEPPVSVPAVPGEARLGPDFRPAAAAAAEASPGPRAGSSRTPPRTADAAWAPRTSGRRTRRSRRTRPRRRRARDGRAPPPARGSPRRRRGTSGCGRSGRARRRR